MNSEKYKPEDPAKELLSPSGNARRKSMRDNLKTEFVRIHARRR